jgi:hypothetical protein
MDDKQNVDMNEKQSQLQVEDSSRNKLSEKPINMETTKLNATLANPLSGKPHELLMEDGENFARKHGMDDLTSRGIPQGGRGKLLLTSKYIYFTLLLFAGCEFIPAFLPTGTSTISIAISHLVCWGAFSYTFIWKRWPLLQPIVPGSDTAACWKVGFEFPLLAVPFG